MAVVFISPVLPLCYSPELQPKSRQRAGSVLYLSSSELIRDWEKGVTTLSITIRRGCWGKAVALCSRPNGSPLSSLPFSSPPSDSAHALASVASLVDFCTFPEWFDPRSSVRKSSTLQSAECVAL